MYGLVRQKNTVYWVAAGVSLLLSVWLAAQEVVINPDAICYLKSASAMSLGLHDAMHLCGQAKWPFFSLLIFSVVKLTHLPYDIAAYALNAIFSLISVLLFIKIIECIKSDTRLLWAAAAIILLSHEFNSVRQYIIRDHGFWACYLLSMYALLQYFRHYEWRYSFLWSVSLLIATLFRIEGAMFLFGLPFLVLFDRRISGIKKWFSFLQLSALTLLSVSVVILYLILHPHIDITRITEVGFQLTHALTLIVQHFAAMKVALAQYVIGSDGAKEAGIVLFLMMASWYCYAVIANVSFVYMALIVYAWVKRFMVTDKMESSVLWGYLIINIIVTSGFLAEHNFLSKRYLIAQTLTLMCWAPFGLDAVLRQWNQRKGWVSLVVFLLFLTSLGGMFDFGYSKKYIHDAGDWVRLNIPLSASLYANDIQVSYYSQHFGNELFTKMDDYSSLNTIANGNWKKFDVLVLRLSHQEVVDQGKLLNEINTLLVQGFSNKRGDQVRIYRRSKL